jgi:cytosine/adenosine deaminase-related metal-dependent hydrolase
LAHLAPADAEAIAARLLKPIIPIEQQLDMVDLIADRHEDRFFTVQYGPVGMEWCSDALLAKVAAGAERSQRRVHMHLLETRYQREWTNHQYQDGPVDHLAKLGLLSHRLTVAHGTWLRPDENEILARHGTTVSVNTSSNLRLKSGIAPLQAMRAAGVRFALGLDALALDDDDDMLRELRLTQLLHGGLGFDHNVARDEIFDAAAHAGVCALCEDSLAGTLVKNAPADFIVLNYEKLAADLYESLDDPFATFFTRARKEHVESVYAAGRKIVDGGRVIGIDEDALQRELAAQLAVAAPALAELKPLLGRFQEGLRRFYTSGGHLLER